MYRRILKITFLADCVSKLQKKTSASLCFQACSEFETSRSQAISENTAAITAAETTAATLKGELADVKQLLLQTKNTLRDDSSLESTAVVLSLESLLCSSLVALNIFLENSEFPQISINHFHVLPKTSHKGWLPVVS